MSTVKRKESNSICLSEESVTKDNTTYQTVSVVNPNCQEDSNKGSSPVPSEKSEKARTVSDHPSEDNLPLNLNTRLKSNPEEGFSSYEENHEVVELKCSEVRWFYRKDGVETKWTPFRGYDSIVLEIAYRKRKELKVDAEMQSLSKDLLSTKSAIVLNGLYEFIEKEDGKTELSSIYYKQDTYEVCRGTWFYIDTMQPLSVDLADAIEEHHLKTFCKHGVFSSTSTDVEPNKMPVLSSLKLSNEEVRWHSALDVSILNHKKGNRIIRFVTRSKGTSYLKRGYSEEALLEDGRPVFSDLILVVHGIGQKGNEHLIAENTTQIRDGVLQLLEKNYPDEKRRPLILPIEWRSSLILDNGITDIVTLPRMPSVRTALNSVAMDIMYYQSPIYRTEIVDGVINQLNSIYSIFKKNNPTFKGAISIYAHSLGSVIVYDILTNWSHYTFYDKFVTNSIKEYIDNCDEDASERPLLENYYRSRKNLSDSDGIIKKVLAGREKQLLFKVKYLFSVGSPLAIFIIMRGADYKTVVPKSEQVERIFNIFHPFDPVAYRLEPLFHENYRNIRPLKLLSHLETRQSYDQMLFECHRSFLKKIKKEKGRKSESCDNVNFEGAEQNGKLSLSPEKDEEILVNDRDGSNPLCRSPTEDQSDHGVKRKEEGSSPVNPSSKQIRNWFVPSVANNNKKKLAECDTSNLQEDVESKDGKSISEVANTMETITLSELNGVANGLELLKKMGEAGTLIDEIPTDRRVPYRMDFQTQPGLTEKTYWAVLKSHFTYWTNLDVTEFVLNILYSNPPNECKSPLDLTKTSSE